MKSLRTKLIIYDSNCKVCSSLRDLILRLTPIPEAKVKAYRELPPDLSARVNPDRFRNVMALIDTGEAETLYGAEGIAYIFSTQYRLLDWLFRFKPFFSLFNFVYKTQAYNRYIIATPKSQFKCDCFPDRVVRYRLSYIFLTWLVAILLTSAFGISLRHFFNDVSPAEAAFHMLLIAGSGWVVQMVAAVFMLGRKALDYVGHLGSIMVVGLLILVPWMLFYAATGVLIPWLPAVSVTMSSAVMLYLHVHRVRYLELSQRWTVSWFLALQAGALFWIYVFYL